MRRHITVLTTVCLLAAWLPATAQFRLDDVDPYLKMESRLIVGDKGELTFDVSLPEDQPRCGALWVFDHVDLEILDSRFGDAQFVTLPEPGCWDCSEGTVRWFHEPTGYLSFEVHVYRRQMHLPCEEEAAQMPEVSRMTDPSTEHSLKQHTRGAQSAQIK